MVKEATESCRMVRGAVDINHEYIPRADRQKV